MIRKATAADVLAIRDILLKSSAVINDNLTKNIYEHILDGVALVIEKESKIKGIWMSMEFDTHISLSYFYIDESERRKPNTMVFFTEGMRHLPKSKRILIRTRDTSGFEKYIEHVEDDIYEFKGLRWDQ